MKHLNPTAIAILASDDAIGLGTTSQELDSIMSANPQKKEDFEALSNQIIEHIIKRHQDKPLYPTFVEYHVRQLAEPLRDVEVRKAASGLTTLANEKQKEQRDKASGKKKPKATAKPALGAAKVSNKYAPIALLCLEAH
jgi:translation initiation factor 3 subunit J